METQTKIVFAFTSRAMSNSSEICSPAFSHSVHPCTAQLYAVLHNHEMSLKTRDATFCVEAASVRIRAKKVPK